MAAKKHKTPTKKSKPTKVEVVEVEETAEQVVEENPEEPTESVVEENPSEELSEILQNNSNKKVTIISFLAGFLLGTVISTGAFYFYNLQNSQANTVSEAVEASPTPSPKPEVILSKYSLQILNGSGVAGRAGEVADTLEEEGLQKAHTGNADSRGFEETTVGVKEGTPSEIYNTIKDVLSDDYDVEKTEALGDDSDFDIVVTVGQALN